MYILECLDHTLYTGITNNIEKRLDLHKTGKGAKYTRRGIKNLKWASKFMSKSNASKLEYRIKSLSRNQKLKIINDEFDIFLLYDKIENLK